MALSRGCDPAHSLRVRAHLDAPGRRTTELVASAAQRRAAPGLERVLALQHSAGNAAVAGLVRKVQEVQVQRCGPVPCDCDDEPVQRQAQAPTDAPRPLPAPPPPQPCPPTPLEHWLREERDAGLLDLPWRGNVPEIPRLPDEVPRPAPGDTAAAAGMLAPTPATPTPGTPTGPPPSLPPTSTPTGPTSAPTAPTNAPTGPTTAPSGGPGTGVGVGLGLGLRLLVAAAAGAVVFFWSNHGPQWMDDTNVLAGGGWANENEWKWWHRTLGEEQRLYLRMLARVRTDKKDLDVTDVSPLEAPSNLLELLVENEDKRKKGQCLGLPVPRRGGNTRHDAYATKVTRSPDDYFVATPTGVAINYDGRSDKVLVWEVKVGHGWMFDPASHQLALRVVAEWDKQRERGLAVALACGYEHVWSVTDRWIRESLLVRWGGSPFVFNIPE